METNENERITRTIELYFSKRIFTHLSLADGKFYNGYIKEISNAGWITFEDRKAGEFPIWIIDIKEIAPYEVRE